MLIAFAFAESRYPVSVECFPDTGLRHESKKEPCSEPR